MSAAEQDRRQKQKQDAEEAERRAKQTAAQAAKEAMFGRRAADEVLVRRLCSRALTYDARSRRGGRIPTQTSSLGHQGKGEGRPLLSRLRPSLVLRRGSIIVLLCSLLIAGEGRATRATETT